MEVIEKYRLERKLGRHLACLLPKAGLILRPEQVAWDNLQTYFENLQRWSFCCQFGQPVPVLSCSHCKEPSLYTPPEIQLFQLVKGAYCPLHTAARNKSLGLPFK